MVTKDGEAKIVDFGLAKLAGQTRLTKTGSTLWTVAYMSPEQAKGKEVDHQTDIWSLGVLLYEMITGKLPFQGDYEQGIIYSIINEVSQPITGLRTGVPLELERIVNKCLEKNRSERYQTAVDLATDLIHVQHGMGETGASKPQAESHTTPGVKSQKRWWPLVVAFAAFSTIGILVFIIMRSNQESPDRKSIAVLPFTNMSDNKEDEYFSDGITEDIIAALSKINELKVISRTSVMQFKGMKKRLQDIGKELGVATVLEGSIRRAGDQVRIVDQLIDAQNEGHLWADTYDEEMTQVFAIQSDVAQKIAFALKAKLSPGEKERIEKKQTENTEAYQLYLKGRFYWNKRGVDDVKTAIEYFKKTIEKDPKYALAYAGLASSYVVLSQHGIPPEECYDKARNAATKALVIDSTLAEAHATLGLIASMHDYDWKGAERLFIRALEFEPGNPSVHQWYSITLSFIGRFDEALSEIKRAQELDPLSLIINMNLGRILYYVGQYDSAIVQYKNTLALDQNFPWTHMYLGSVYEVQRRFDEAIAEYEKARSLYGSSPFVLPYLGCAYARAGRGNDGQQVLEDLLLLAQQGDAVSSGIAFIYYELGEKEKAFEWFEKAYQSREIELLHLVTDPLWVDFRSDPRCITLLKKMGLEK
jgi:TolB-like protein/Flp pilus assembly protein TadD